MLTARKKFCDFGTESSRYAYSRQIYMYEYIVIDKNYIIITINQFNNVGRITYNIEFSVICPSRFKFWLRLSIANIVHTRMELISWSNILYNLL